MRKILAIVGALLFSGAASAASYHAFGDSIAYGDFSSPTTHAYVSLLGDALNQSITNHGTVGDEVPDMTAKVYGVTAGVGDVHTVEITNDAHIYCPSPCSSPASSTLQGYYRIGLEALTTYLATPAKHTARDGSVTYSGSCWGNTAVYGIGRNSNCNGDSASFSVSGNVIYAGVIQQDGAPGQCTFAVDGVTQAVFNTQTTGLGPTTNGVTYGAALVRMVVGGSVSASHSVTVTVTSPTAAANRCYLDWYAGNYQPSGLSKVYVANIPYAQAYSVGGSNANTDAFNGQITSLVSELAGDGLAVAKVDVNAALNPATDMDGGYHPVRGHPKMFVKFYCTMTGVCP